MSAAPALHPLGLAEATKRAWRAVWRRNGPLRRGGGRTGSRAALNVARPELPPLKYGARQGARRCRPHSPSL